MRCFASVLKRVWVLVAVVGLASCDSGRQNVPGTPGNGDRPPVTEQPVPQDLLGPEDRDLPPPAPPHVTFLNIATPVTANLGQGVLNAIDQKDRNGYDPAFVLDPACMIGEVAVRTQSPSRDLRTVYGPTHLPGSNDDTYRRARLSVIKELDPWGFLPKMPTDFPANLPRDLLNFSEAVLTYDPATSLSFTTTVVAKSLTSLWLENENATSDTGLACGEAYVQSLRYGAALQIVMTARFPTAEDRAAFQAEFGYNAPFAYGETEAATLAARLTELGASVDMKIAAVGGPTETMNSLASASTCTAETLQDCLDLRDTLEAEFEKSLTPNPSLANGGGWVPVGISIANYPPPPSP